MCVAGETVTAADSTHPTGMHSCSLYVVTEFSELSDRKIVFQKHYSNLQPHVYRDWDATTAPARHM